MVVEHDFSLVTTHDEDTILDAVVKAFNELNEVTDQLSGEKVVTIRAVLPIVRLIKSLLYPNSI